MACVGRIKPKTGVENIVTGAQPAHTLRTRRNANTQNHAPSIYIRQILFLFRSRLLRIECCVANLFTTSIVQCSLFCVCVCVCARCVQLNPRTFKIWMCARWERDHADFSDSDLHQFRIMFTKQTVYGRTLLNTCLITEQRCATNWNKFNFFFDARFEQGSVG